MDPWLNSIISQTSHQITDSDLNLLKRDKIIARRMDDLLKEDSLRWETDPPASPSGRPYTTAA